ncbi:AEC family transporter [Pelagibius sp. Alg239-R121]|uniref:AEC family transporter n=1 Tax=Pelagibius sp. Alg239-R121 TaxID=2993448 RepID=UPI0024A74444|nr:AEC family transporter [Pelagibius sp. Alg239-R121]
MLEAFLTDVAPVAAVGVVGWLFGRAGLFNGEDARSINRFVFFVALPVLLFRLLAEAPREAFDALLAGGYLASEFLLYFLGFAVARWGFRRELRESLLLGMASAFVNHVFFVLPVALNAYGADAGPPILTIVAVDSVVLYAGTILMMDWLSAQNVAPLRVIGQTLKNPHVIGIALGIAVNLSGLSMPEGLGVFADFVGSAASPAALFAIGLVLSARGGGVGTAVAWAIAGLKIVVHPAIAWAVFSFLALPVAAIDPALLVAAGPCGALAFVIALHYEVPVDAIARAILISTVGSLVGLSVLI